MSAFLAIEVKEGDWQRFKVEKPVYVRHCQLENKIKDLESKVAGLELEEEGLSIALRIRTEKVAELEGANNFNIETLNELKVIYDKLTTSYGELEEGAEKAKAENEYLKSCRTCGFVAGCDEMPPECREYK